MGVPGKDFPRVHIKQEPGIQSGATVRTHALWRWCSTSALSFLPSLKGLTGRRYRYRLVHLRLLWAFWKPRARSFFRISHMGAGVQIFGLSSTAFPGVSVGSWIDSRAVRTGTIAHEMPAPKQQLYPPCFRTNPISQHLNCKAKMPAPVAVHYEGENLKTF